MRRSSFGTRVGCYIIGLRPLLSEHLGASAAKGMLADPNGLEAERKFRAELTADIVVAHVSNNTVSVRRLSSACSTPPNAALETTRCGLPSLGLDTHSAEIRFGVLPDFN
jgi:hypothetical protein